MSLQWLMMMILYHTGNNVITMMMILYHSGNNVITMANDDDFISFR